MKSRLYLLLNIIFIINTAAQEKNLSYFIDQALINSPLLKDFQDQMRLGRIDSMFITVNQHPQIAASSVNSYAPVINGWGYDEAITNGANITALLSVSKSFISRRNLENQYHIIQLQREALINQCKITKQDLKKNVIDQYINAYAAWQQYLLDKEVLEMMRTEEQVLRTLAEHAVYKQSEYLSFNITLDWQAVTVKQDEKDFRFSLNLLNYLCGLKDTSFVKLTDPDLTVTTLPEIENSVFYHQFVTDSLMLVANTRQNEFSYNPKLSLYADAGYISSLIYTPWKNFGVSAGFNLSIPLYNGILRRLENDKLAIALNTNRENLIFFENQYHQKINMLFQELQYCEQIRQQTGKHYTMVQDLMKTYRKLMDTGDVSIMEYYLAVTNYINARNNIIQNEVTRYRVINEINYWNETR